MADHRHQAACAALIRVRDRSAPRSHSARYAIDGFASTKSSTVSRSIDEVALRSRWPPIPSHRAGRIVALRRAQLARLGARSANLGQTAHYSQAIAHFVDRRSRDRSPGLHGVAGCPAPTAFAEQLHAQHDWVQTPSAPMGVVGRSVGEAAVALQAVTGRQPGEEATWFEHNRAHLSALAPDGIKGL